MKNKARSASSSSSASIQRSGLRAGPRSSSKAVNDSNSLDILSENSSTVPRRVKGGRTLVIRAGALGDTILAIPALRALHDWNREGRLELAGYPSMLRVAGLAVPVDGIHSIDRALFAGLFSDRLPPELENFLRAFDLVVAWFQKDPSHLSRKLGRAKIPCIQANPHPSTETRVHASLHLLRSLSPLGIPVTVSPPKLKFPPEASRAAREFLSGAALESRFIAIHPGSGSVLKNWEPKSFAGLADRARASDRQVLIIEGEADREAAKAFRGALSWHPPTALELALPVLGSVLSQAEAFVGNDSGVSHLAAASGAPTVALFGTTDPAIWAPLGPWVEILPQTASVQEVWEAVSRLAARRTEKGASPA